jgi:hypothetical protein
VTPVAHARGSSVVARVTHRADRAGWASAASASRRARYAARWRRRTSDERAIDRGGVPVAGIARVVRACRVRNVGVDEPASSATAAARRARLAGRRWGRTTDGGAIVVRRRRRRVRRAACERDHEEKGDRRESAAHRSKLSRRNFRQAAPHDDRRSPRVVHGFVGERIAQTAEQRRFP